MYTRRRPINQFQRARAVLNGPVGDRPGTTLATVWQLLPVDYCVEQLGPVQQSVLTLDLYYPRIGLLCQKLLTHNAAIAQGKEQSLYKELQATKQHRTTVGLGMFLTDEDGYGVDPERTFTRLKGLLQDHQYWLHKTQGGYYERMSVLFYHDVRHLAHILLNGDLP